jgi:hypothetical protein
MKITLLLLTFFPLSETGFDVDSYRWKNRLILVFTPSWKQQDYLAQMDIWLSDREGMAERDLVLIELPESGLGRVGEAQLRRQDVAALYERYDVEKGGFCVLLIGKDGGVKLRSDSPLKTDDLFGLIDSMPMRQREIRERQPGPRSRGLGPEEESDHP